MPYRIVCFNASYDTRYLREIIDDSTRLESKGKFITAKLNNGIPIIDLMNFCDYGLENWMEFLKMDEQGVRKVKTVCSGCGQERAEFDVCHECGTVLNWTLEHIYERNKHDTKATWILANYVQDFLVDECNINMKATISSTTLALWEKCFAKEQWIRDGRFNDLEREAYKGGRTELFRRNEQHYYKYDINSMYCSIMRDKDLPNPTSALFISQVEDVDRKEFYEFFEKDYLMIINCHVDVPKMRIAPLPVKDNKLLFKSGKFEGTWTSVELKKAIEYGAKIKKVNWYILYLEKDKYLSSFANFIWFKRAEYKKRKILGMEIMIKKMGNSLYGKFGQQNCDNPSKWVKVNPEELEEWEALSFREVEGDIYMYRGEGEKWDSEHTFPCISVFITSYARIMLLEKLKEHEKHVIYCDTDSLFLSKPLIKDSGELGEFKFEGEGDTPFYRPKFYGEKAKGVPKRAKVLEETDEYIRFEFRRPLRRDEAIRAGIPQNTWITVEKILYKNDDKREWEGDDSMAIYSEGEK